MSIETLRAVNGIGARSRVPVGHTLLVPTERPSNEAAQTLAQAMFTSVPSGRTFYYTARRGDTMVQVAARYGVTVQEVKVWNGLTHERLVAGQTLRVTSDVVPVTKAGGKTKRAVATRGAGKQTASKPAAAKPVSNGKDAPTARANGNAGG
jgi:membrane-bound lytic murein transglycosylase D